jgi:hypothetical protein
MYDNHIKCLINSKMYFKWYTMELGSNTATFPGIWAFTLFPTVPYIITRFRVLTVILDIATKWCIFVVAIATYIIDDWNLANYRQHTKDDKRRHSLDNRGLTNLWSPSSVWSNQMITIISLVIQLKFSDR